jgi:hypothetical protein
LKYWSKGLDERLEFTYWKKGLGIISNLGPMKHTPF